MSNLEHLAKELFENFGERETGVRPIWAYLNDERKKAWMAEVYEISQYVLTDLRLQVQQVPNLGNTNTSWANGFNEGVRQERVNLITRLEAIDERLKDELNEGPRVQPSN